MIVFNVRDPQGDPDRLWVSHLLMILSESVPHCCSEFVTTHLLPSDRRLLQANEWRSR